MRRILVVLLLAAVLAAFFFLNRALARWHYVVPAEPGELLYATTFDAFNDDWTQYEGRLSAQVADGVLRLSVSEPVAFPYSAASPHFGNFDIRVQARAVEGPENNGYGIIFRQQDADNLYSFLISSDGYYQVSRIVNGVSREISLWIQSPHVNMGIGALNTLRVIGRGDQFRFFVNDQPLLLCIPNDPNAQSTYDWINDVCVDGQMLDTLVDSSIPSGRLGVAAMTVQGSEPGVVVEFDNVLVYGPEVE